jgi:DNA-directed RNA polymerase I and III subunit RPAC2
MQQPETDFCGYTVPHPYEPKMNVRLQTYRGTAPTIKVLRAGLTDMEKMCDLISEKFERALQEYDGVAAPEAQAAPSQATKKAKASKAK